MIHSLAFSLPDPEHSPVTRAILVAGYLAAALCWLQAGLQTGVTPEKSSRRWWIVGACLLFLLAANKTFDFRSQCETFFRTLAQANGWYERRQPVQFFLAIVLPILAGLLLLGLLWLKTRPFIRQHPLALAGWFMLFVYLALRQVQEWKPALAWLAAVHYHQWRLVLEVVGIGLAILAAITARTETPKKN